MRARMLLCLMLCSALSAGTASCLAGTIRVDATPAHVTNVVRPDRALGAGVDLLPYGAADKLLTPGMIRRILSAGWQPISYRQNTELHAQAWHWNPHGSWSEPGGRGYFVGDARPDKEPIIHSYGYSLPRRGVTRDDGTGTDGYSRLTDGDEGSFWKSNPYLAQRFTGDPDTEHPQWVILDLGAAQKLSAIRIDWADPYATRYLVQYWRGGDDPERKPADGAWILFPHGGIEDGHGGNALLRLANQPVRARWVRVLMTASSNTCAGGDHSDPRNCVGYAIREIYLGTMGSRGHLHDVVRHTPDQDQTATYCSSVDPWHESRDLDEQAGDQVGFDRFFTSGITRGLPAIIPIAMLYSTPEDAVAELSYLERRGYPISYVEMGEEPDGHYANPEDYAALYVQFAAALHKLDPRLKLGGPIFTGENEDIRTWANAAGNVSWTARFIDYLRAHGALGELSFFSFEHYPVVPGTLSWASLYDEPDWVTRIMKVWRQDGVPPDVPLFITESNLSSQYSEAYLDLWGGLWLADYVGAFFTAGGNALYYYHDMPLPMGSGENNSAGTFSFFSADAHFNIEQPLAQYFVSRMVNLQWLQPGDSRHRLFAATSDIDDGAGHTLVTAYPVLRPDGQWALLIVNKDQGNSHTVGISFEDSARHRSSGFTGKVTELVLSPAQYQWHPAPGGGRADPDGPPLREVINATPQTRFVLPAASVVVLRGRSGL